MRIGKISESVLKRSVLRQIKWKRDEILVGAGLGEDCAILASGEEDVLVLSMDPITGASDQIGLLAVQGIINDIATSGAEPIGIMLSLLLPEDFSEAELKKLMIEVEQTCASLNIQLMGGHTEVTDAVKRPIITVTGVGKAKKETVLSTKGARPGQDVVLSKWIGLEGTSIAAREKTEILEKKFPPTFLEEAKAFERYLSIVPEAATAIRSGVTAMHDVTEGGIFGALWELAESSGVGLEIELKKISIKQETIEICEVLELNPYELISGGALLMVTDHGSDLVRILEEKKIHAVVIGKTTEGNDRVVFNEEEKRFLEPPKPDQIYKLR